MATIASTIRKLRHIREFTQDYLADQMNVSIRTYREIEAGRISPTLDQMDSAAKAFQCTFPQLLCFNPETCQFESDTSKVLEELISNILLAVLSDTQIPFHLKSHIQQIIQEAAR